MDYFVFVVPILATIIMHFSDLHVPIATAIIISIIISIPLVFLARWPQRISNHRERKYLLKQKKHTVTGIIASIAKYDTGKTKPVQVIDGFTQRFASLDIYTHYHIEHQKIYDGYEAIVYIANKDGVYYDNNYIIVRTLPSTFFNKMDHFPRIDKKNMSERTIAYVEDFDGEKYYIPSSNNEDIYDDEDYDM